MSVALGTNGLYNIQYYEVPDLYEEQWRPDGTTLVRGCRCLWSQREQFVLDMMGRVAAVDAATGRMERYLPHEHPCYSGLFAVDCTLREKLGVPNQDSAGRITFDERHADGSAVASGAGDGSGWAVYAVTYTRPNFRIKADAAITSERERYVVKLRKFSISALSIPGQAFEWGPRWLDPPTNTLPNTGTPSGNPGVQVPANQEGEPLAGNVTKNFPAMTLVYKWLQVPDVPDTKIASAMGKVNAATWEGYGAETLLLESVNVEPKQHSNSDFYWEISYSWVYRPTGWNKIYNREAGNLIPVVNVTAGQPSVYDTTDFDELFKLV